MPTRRLRLAMLLVLGTLTIPLSVQAQFPKVPRVPKVPGTTAPQPATTSATPPTTSSRLTCASITPEMIDRFLKALAAERGALETESAAAKAKQQAAASNNERLAQQQLDAMVKYSECTDAEAAKDPQTKEVDRLTALAEAATAKGDDKLAEKYSDQASTLSNAVSTAAMKNCQSQTAQLEAIRRSGEDQAAASNAASSAMRNAESNAAKAGARAGDLTEDEFALLKECIAGRLQTPNTTPTSAASAAAIDARRDELKKALGIR